MGIPESLHDVGDLRRDQLHPGPGFRGALELRRSQSSLQFHPHVQHGRNVHVLLLRPRRHDAGPGQRSSCPGPRTALDFTPREVFETHPRGRGAGDRVGLRRVGLQHHDPGGRLDRGRGSVLFGRAGVQYLVQHRALRHRHLSLFPRQPLPRQPARAPVFAGSARSPGLRQHGGADLRCSEHRRRHRVRVRRRGRKARRHEPASTRPSPSPRSACSSRESISSPPGTARS